MNQKAIQALVESLADDFTQSNPEIMKAMRGTVDKHLAPLLKALPSKAVTVGCPEEIGAAGEKLTFSKFLGDVRRFNMGQEPKHLKSRDDLVRVAIKSLYGSGTTEGGYLVPTQQSGEVLNLMSYFSAIRDLCREVPMSGRQIVFPTITGGPTAYWVPETQDDMDTTNPSGFSQATGFKPPSSATFGQLALTVHVLATKVTVSNQLLDDSDPGVDAILRELFAECLGAAFDLATLEGAGTALDPITGLANRLTTNVFQAGADFDFDDVVDLIFGPRVYAPRAQEIPVIGHPLAEKNMLKIKDNTGKYIYATPREPGATPTLWGEPFHRDGNVLTNLGPNQNETRLIAGDFRNSAFVGLRQGLAVKVNPWAEPGFSHNQTTFLAETRIGFNISTETRFAVLNGVPTT
ncbi:MAG: phage major capsid protein [Pseudomonadota bacterium]